MTQRQVLLPESLLPHLLGGWLVLFVVLFLPRGWGVSPFKEVKLYLLGVLALALLPAAKRIPRTWISGVILAMLLTAAASTLLSGASNAVLLYGVQGRFEGLLYVLFFHVALLMLYATLATRRIHPGPFLPYLGFTILVEAVIALLQTHGIDPVREIALKGLDVEPGIGTFGNYGITASFLSLGTAVLLCNLRRQPWLILPALLSALALMTLGNRSSIVLLALPVLSYAFATRSIRLSVLASFVVLVVVVGHQPYSEHIKPMLIDTSRPAREFSNTGTLQTRRIMWDIARQNLFRWPTAPWLGAGDDNYRKTQNHTDPDTLLKLVMLETGLQPKNLRTTIHEGRKTYAYDTSFCKGRFCLKFRETLVPTNTRAHNQYLDRYYQYGVFYVAGLLAIFFGGWWRSMRNFTEMAFLFGAITAILVYFVFWFAAIPNEILLYAIALIALARTVNPPHPTQEKATP